MPRRFVGLALGLLMVAGGCSGGSGTVVKGKVLMDGQPLSQAEVVLAAKDKPGPGSYMGKTDEQGNFEIKSFGQNPIKPGSYRVLVSKLVDKKTGKAPPNEEEYEQMRARDALRNIVPPKYSSDSSDLFAEVKPGENVLPPFDLKGK